MKSSSMNCPNTFGQDFSAILMLTRHEPSAAVTHSNNVTSQLVQEAFGFAVRVKEPQLRHSTVGAVWMWQV